MKLGPLVAPAVLALFALLPGCAADTEDSDPADPNMGETEDEIRRNVNLGPLDEPGSALGGKTFVLARGRSITFESGENQIRCIREFTASPSSALTAKRVVLEANDPNRLGGITRLKHTLTVSQSAEIGSVITVTTSTCFQVRNNPGWKFSFKVKVG